MGESIGLLHEQTVDPNVQKGSWSMGKVLFVIVQSLLSPPDYTCSNFHKNRYYGLTSVVCVLNSALDLTSAT
jgi:hypothetical protein